MKTLLPSILLTILATACGSDETSSQSGSSGQTASSGGTASSSTGGTTSSSSGGTSGGFKVCPVGKCTEADWKTYQTCGTTKCDAEYKAAYGADYAKGTFSGPCGEVVSCSQKCACNDTACTQNCGKSTSAACIQASTPVATCIQKNCTLPACATSTPLPDGGTGGGTCADLKTCCGKIADTTKKAQCDAAYNGAKLVGDMACGPVYNNFKADCP